MGIPEPFAEGIDVFLRGIAAETDAQGPVNRFGIETHGLQHVAAGALLAGGALGDIDLAGFEEVHQNLAAPAGQRDGENMRRTTANDPQLRDIRLQAADDLLPLAAHSVGVLPELRRGDLAGGGEGGDLRGGFRPGAASVLLAAADDHGLQAQPLADIQGADALGRVNLVPADADHVDAQRLRCEGDLHEGLDSVRVQQRLGAFRFQHGRDTGNVRDGAGLVVDEHERDENCILPQRLADRIHRNRPGEAGLQTGDLKTALFQQVETAADGVVLGHRADDMIPPALHAFGAGEQGPVVAFGTAGGENELCRGAAQRRCHRSTGAIEELFGFPAGGMGGARVPELLSHGEKCSLRGFRADLCGGGIIQIMHCVLPYSARKALRAFGALITSFIFLLLRYFIVDFLQRRFR